MSAREQKLIETAHTTTIAEQHLHYRTAGAGTPLVLIHGYGVTGHIWQRMLPYLIQQHQVFIVDLPGHGHSPFTGTWQLREVAPLLAQWLQQMKLPPVALMGQSMGGAIAIHLTAYAPELVKRLVLVSAAGIPFQARLPTLALRSVHSFFQRGNGSYPLELVQDVLRPRIRLLWQSAQEIAHSDFRAELATITVPTLIIWGERDVLIPITSGHALSAALPHATFITLPGCGHRPMLAQPETMSKLVLDFLK
ncbi:MAG: alpha/beta hydrolase [Chloroflexi bacterium]|nr:alpha/beta hydrolase [Chloroflexota bacterium]